MAEYSRHSGVSDDTIRRWVHRLLRPVCQLLRDRRPGPTSRGGPSLVHQALEAANSFLHALLPESAAQLLARSPARRGVVVQLAGHWQQRGVPLEVLAGFLGLSGRTLRRWIRRFQREGQDREVPHRSRRPHRSPKRLPGAVQEALWLLGRAFPDRSVAEIARIFNGQFRWLLDEEGLESVSAKTAGKYIRRCRRPQRKRRSSSRRGDYRYPAPLSMAWVDTTYFKVAGCTIHIVGALEASSRIALAADAFVQERTETTIEILEGALARVPELCALVRDRGTPYLNEEVSGYLADHGVLPIDAHPYFPIDKAALERWWRTVKEWLRLALQPYEEQCRREGTTPTREEIVRIVRPALRVFVRAYNLLPQSSLDGRSPIERIEALLRGVGESGFNLSELRQTAMLREDKDVLLTEIRDALQVNIPVDRIRRDFIGISRAAIRTALRDCARKLVIDRDPQIRDPYRYLLAVARIKEREHQEDQGRSRALGAQTLHLEKQHHQALEELRREQEQRSQHPESWLFVDLEQWVRDSCHPVAALRERAASRLGETLENLRLRLGAAAAAPIGCAREKLSSMAADRYDLDQPSLENLRTRFDEMAARPPPKQDPTPSQPTPGPGQVPRSGPSWTALNDSVRKVLRRLQAPHDYRTDVSSQHS